MDERCDVGLWHGFRAAEAGIHIPTLWALVDSEDGQRWRARSGPGRSSTAEGVPEHACGAVGGRRRMELFIPTCLRHTANIRTTDRFSTRAGAVGSREAVNAGSRRDRDRRGAGGGHGSGGTFPWNLDSHA